MRTYAILGAAVIAFLAILGTITAIFGSLVLAFILTNVALVVAFVMVLLSTRYLARLSRTEHRKTTAVLVELGDRLENLVQNSKVNDIEQRRLGDNRIDSLTEMLSNAGVKTEKQLDRLDDSIRKSLGSNARHITQTVRDGSRQVEAAVQLNSRFVETKLPMPGTGGFAIDAQALSHLLSLVDERQPRQVLELGSGTSTIWLGYLCRTYGGRVVSLDHLEQYLELTRTAITRHSLNDQVETRLAPLEEIDCDGETYSWYAPSALDGLAEIELVLIDGPPASTGPEARYPALPNIVNLLAPNAVVILDDAHRQDEEEIVQAWLESYPEFRRIEMGTSRLAVMERSS